jgi:Methyltransferase domain
MRFLFKKNLAERMSMDKLSEEALARQIAEQLGRGLAFDRNYFRLWEQYGFHITPNHFYQPIPDVSQLKETLWERPADLAGIDMNDAGQLALLDQVCAQYKSEYNQFPDQPTSIAYEYYFNQLMFRSVDAEILYCIIRHFKPARIVEIGSGFSTLVAAAACRKNHEAGYVTELTCVEPYPSDVLRRGVPGLARLIATKLEDVDVTLFTSLAANDILFIDSSHVLRIGNDVYYEYLHILPQMAPGVFVHVHDIFLPFEYPRQWVMDEYRFWTEQYLLQAFLMFNHSFKVVWGGSYMHHKYGDKLRGAFRSYNPEAVLPGSFWMQRV